MKTSVLQTEHHRKFEPFVRLRWVGPPSAAERRGRVDYSRRRREQAETIASFAETDRISPGNAGRKLRNGTLADHPEVREWCAHFQPDATLSSQPLPVAAPQPQAAKAVHNRILIADDDALVRGSLAAVLESEGFLVDEAQNGIEAVTRAIEYKPDLVLLDLNMPHCDGWTAFRQLDRATPLLPVIVITARPNQYQNAVQLGVDAFMEKPLNIPILVQAIIRLTSEGDHRHVQHITKRGFVTQLLGGPES